MRRFIFVGLFLLGVPSLAGAQSMDLDPYATQVTRPVYDAAGRMIESETLRYDGDGMFLGTVNSTWKRDRKGRTMSSETISTSPDGEVFYRMVSRWSYDVEGATMVIHRTRYGADGQVKAIERERWADDSELPITTVETQVRDARDQVVETRYKILEKDARGRLVSRDVSAYDAEGTQRRRLLERWFYDGARVSTVESWTFDENDELTRHEVQDWSYDAKGRNDRIDWTIFVPGVDGQEVVSSFRHEHRTFDGRTSRQTARTMTWTDADDVPVRRMTEEIAYDADGKVSTRRASFSKVEID